MDSLSPQVVSAAKLPILNPNKFDLWKMRIEQYFLMTDYSLWEVILNGDSPIPTRIVEGVLQPVAPTTTEQKLARKNELKARGTLLMAFPDKHQLNFNSHKDAKTLIEAIENSLKIYEAEVKHSSSTGTTTQNLAFVSSSNTNSITESLSAVASVFAVCANMPVSSFPNVDSLSNATCRNLGVNGPTSMGFDMSKVECYNYHRKGHFARECRDILLGSVGLPRFQEGLVQLSHREGLSQLRPQQPMPWFLSVMVQEVMIGAIKQKRSLQTLLLWLFHQTHLVIMSYNWSYQAEEEPANYALMAFSSSSFSSDNEESNCESWPPTSLYDRFQASDGYYAITPPYTGTFMPPKPDLVFNTALTTVKTDHSAFTV
uniref:Uncharacterized protein n=1 Tax=Tanacetum cinerariifolium TaxID=118510 RepID=A0A6L2L5A1_TANCI|nr:hypothetical protein [Tanacetum cinerariifolium]